MDRMKVNSNEKFQELTNQPQGEADFRFKSIDNKEMQDLKKNYLSARIKEISDDPYNFMNYNND